MSDNIVELNEKNYKVVKIALIEPLSEKEYAALSFLNGFFPSSEFFIKIENKKVIVYVHEVDFKLLENKASELIRIYGLQDDNIIKRIIRSLEAIKSYGLKGRKRLYVDYDKERKVKGRKHKELERGKFYYAFGNNFSKKNNELPPEYVNKIICGDAEEVLKKLPNNCIDLIFTSPPYNFGLEYENHKDGINWGEYFRKLFLIFNECIRVLKYGGRIIINIQPLFSDYIPIHHIISNFFMENKLIWKGEIIWDKHNYNCKYTAWGSWKSPSNPYLKYTWEFLEIFCKGDLTHKGSSNKADITAEEFKKWVYARWDIAPVRDMKKWGHPAMFPEELVERVLKLFSFEGDFVLDPFNGVGTTTKVAKELNRRFIGIDISQDYCKKAEERLSGAKRKQVRYLKESDKDEENILNLFDF